MSEANPLAGDWSAWKGGGSCEEGENERHGQNAEREEGHGGGWASAKMSSVSREVNLIVAGVGSTRE